jgi:DNA-binding NarL/FixJ family response regulator
MHIFPRTTFELKEAPPTNDLQPAQASFATMNHTLLIYEDNARLRQSLELLLGDESGFEVLGSFEHCGNVQQQVQALKPNLVVMDIDMPGRNGIEGVKVIKQVAPDTRVMMYTVFDDDDRIFESICNGADGYLLKNTPPLKLIQALHDLAEGAAPMSPYVAQKVFQHFRQQPPPPNYDITTREKEILQQLVAGNSYKMIADHCSISIETVKKHLQNIYSKLHVSCGTEAVAKAIKDRVV